MRSMTAMFEPGATIGHYRILNKLGEGGMGAVYLGEHVLLGRRAAIKVLLPALSAEPSNIKRFFNEARAVSLLSDPGIVQVYDFGYHTDGSAFLVMEALDGEAMSQRLRRIRRFGLLDCLRLVQLICSALEVAHDKRIVHRDLKPGNIFLVPGAGAGAGAGASDGERVKVLDFGIAKLSADGCARPMTRVGALLGTPAYMSPEQCRGTTDIDLRSDVYAIGCVMFVMLTGGPPFRSKLPGELIAAHLKEAPPLARTRLAGLPLVIDDILQRCLKKAPAERFPSMTALGDAIAAAERALRQCRPAAIPDEPGGAPADAVLPDLHTAAVDSTTLRGASGQSLFAGIPPLSPEGSPRGRRWIGIGLAVGAAILGGGTAAILSRGAAAQVSSPLATPTAFDDTSRRAPSRSALAQGATTGRSALAADTAASDATPPSASRDTAPDPSPPPAAADSAQPPPPATPAPVNPRPAGSRSPGLRRGDSRPPPRPSMPGPRSPEQKASYATSAMSKKPIAIDPLRLDRGD